MRKIRIKLATLNSEFGSNTQYTYINRLPAKRSEEAANFAQKFEARGLPEFEVGRPDAGNAAAASYASSDRQTRISLLNLLP